MASLKREATMAKRAREAAPTARRRRAAGPAISVRQGGQQVTELVALGAQILAIVGVGRDLQGHPLDDMQPVAFQPGALRRVVGEQAQVLHPEIDEDLGADPVVTQISLEAQQVVRFDRVFTLVLQLVGPDLVVETDAASFLTKVDDDASSLTLNDRERLVELRAT